MGRCTDVVWLSGAEADFVALTLGAVPNAGCLGPDDVTPAGRALLFLRPAGTFLDCILVGTGFQAESLARLESLLPGVVLTALRSESCSRMSSSGSPAPT